jgi:predicted DNA-binding antitoxin AbrB/MazE fold protein
MGSKRQTIRALYKDGVLRPLEPLDLPDESKVELTVDPEGVVKRFEALLRSVQDRNRGIPPEEIERDIELAIKEVREEGQAPRK